MKTERLLENMFIEKNLKQSTKNGYKRAVEHFEKHTQQSLHETLTQAEKEETQWKKSTLRTNLISFRREMYETYKKDTAKGYYGKIISLLNYYEINIGKLPPINMGNDNRLKDSSELPSQETLKLCIELKNNNLLRSTTLLMSSTGLSPIDLLNLTIDDYLKSTRQYHQYYTHFNILNAIHEMKDKEVVATFKGNRQKTKTQYITFASPEAIKATNLYLLSRTDKLNIDSPLFKTSRRHLNKLFQDTNDQLGLGETSEGISCFSPKNLRSYHATQLEIAGMSDSRIDILQGRKTQSIIRRHYIKVNVDVLREEYIKCLPYLVVDDMNKIKTELDVVKEENAELKDRQDKLDEILARIELLEKM